ncbi:MAG: NUDIX hydrolase [Christensenellaceae bacterium]|jgi:8-oxo-dGTP diphosphatase
MLSIEFYNFDQPTDSMYKYAVIVSRYKRRWIFSRHKERATWEIPAGHKEQGETILEAARRELFEETGATDFTLFPICAFVVSNDPHSYGYLCFAEILELGPLPPFEIAEIKAFKGIPSSLTYPEVQPILFNKVQQYL